MDMTMIATKQEVQNLILKCYQESISGNIAGLDILFNSSNSVSTLIEVKIPKKQRPKFRVLDAFQETPAVKNFSDLIESESSGKLKVLHSSAKGSAEEGNFFHTVLSIEITCNYKIEE